MDRQFIYPGQVPLETDLLNTNRNTMVALGALIGDLIGTNTVFSGLSVVPTIPATMSVTVNPGHVYSLQNIDNTAYSSLAANEAQQIMKQGLLATAQTLAMTAPVTAGQSVNYLISAAFVEQDIAPTVLPYYNAENPQVAWSGPGGLGGLNNTTRQDTVALTLTPGVPATTGTQTTPATPTGTTPLYVVAVANGATTIVAANISSVSGAPVLPSGFLQSLITSNLTYGIDNGSTNTIQAMFPIPVTALVDGMDVWVKIKAANTGATTFTPNPGVIAAAPVVGSAHNALQGGETVASGRANLVYRADITSWVMVECTGGADQVAPATESQHAVQFGQVAGVVGSVRNLVSSVTVASATKTVTADEVIVETALGGLRYCLSSLNLTGNLATQMDTGSAPASGYVAEYVVYNPNAAISGTNPRLLYQTEGAAAATSIYSGAFMPAGYTASALSSVWRTTSGSLFAVGAQQDRHIDTLPITVLNTGTLASTPTAFSLAAAVPKSAKVAYMNSACSYAGGTSLNSQVYSAAAGFGVGTTAGANGVSATGGSGSSGNRIYTPQTLFYELVVVGSPSSQNVNYAVNGYDI